PTGNSVAALTLLRLEALMGESGFRDQADKLLRSFGALLGGAPAALGEMLLAVDFYLAEPREVVMVRPAGTTDVELLDPVRGGCGLVITEAAAVTPAGRISPPDLGVWKDEHVPELARIVRFIDGQGAVAGMQLAHAGRKASTPPPWKGRRVLAPGEEGGFLPMHAPSPIPFRPEDPVPEELDSKGI